MSEKLSRRELIKKTIRIGAIAGGAAVLGAGAYSFLREHPIEELYGAYPEGAANAPLAITNPAAPKPNIILMYCDDLGYGDIGCNGGTAIRTPNIDSLARRGFRATDCYACNAVCAPSRAGLLTGRYPFRTGIIGNTYPKGEPIGRVLARKFGDAFLSLGVMDIREKYVARGISDHEITLAEGLKKAGYRTGMVGKWHLGDYSKQPEFNPRRHGFDEYFGVPHSNDMIPCPLFKNEEMLEADIGKSEATQKNLTGLYTREALKFIEESGRTPFFLYFAHTYPHQPIYASKRFEKKSKAGIYGDAVEEIDWSVGEILSMLRRKGIENNTLFIFMSDNGPWYEGSSGRFRGRKGQSYEGGFRVPFIAAWPGRIPAGRVSSTAIMNLDLYPTLFGLAGIGLPGDRMVDGKDISAILTGATSASPHEAVYFYHYERLEGVRAGKWKYFDKTDRYTWPIALDTAPVPDTLGGKQMGVRWPLLYDLETDPGECYNMINTHPQKAAELKAMMKEWAKKTKKDPRGFGRG